MKRIPVLFRFFLGSIFITMFTSHLYAERQITQLASDWKFIKQDADIAAATSNWETVTIPHTWNTIDDISEIRHTTEANELSKKLDSDAHLKNGYYQGTCWYAKTLNVPAEWKGKKRVFIRFGAASLVAKTYINQQILGEHRGAFTAFAYELTDYLKFGEDNEIRVEVDNSNREDIPPLSGDFNLWGGLYRPAELIVTDMVCITPLNYASPGIYLTTKSLDKKKAVVEVKSLISNGDKPKKSGIVIPPAKVTVEAEIKNADGEIMAQTSSEQNVQAEETMTFTHTLKFDNPHLWQGRKGPYLYTATVRVIRDGKTVDEVTQPLGLRKVEITKKQGFLLNGQPYPIQGVCRHQDNRDKGWALSPSDEETDANLIMELGATAVRNAHYPQSQSWHSLADRLGLLLWDEVPVVNGTRDTRAFWLNTDEQMREMVHQLYNHPSIAWWGIYNEIGNRLTPPSGPQLRQLRDIAKGIDPGRIVVAASNRIDRYFNLIPDNIGFNYYPGWYSKMEQFAEYIESRAKEVGNRIALSEYGAGGVVSQHTEGPPKKPNPVNHNPFQPEEWQTYVHQCDWAVIRNNPNMWGSFIWVMFDFTSSNRNEGNTPALNTKGMVTHDRRIRKDAYFLYKANWNPEPMVYIASRRSVNRRQSTTEVKVFSNADEVELKVNGKSAGKVKPDEIKVCRWGNVSLSPGENKIEAAGYYGDKTITDNCQWMLESNKANTNVNFTVSDSNSGIVKKYVDIGDAYFYYEIAGQGTPVILIHAHSVDCRMWDPQFLELAKHYKVIRYDLRGYGKTDKPLAGERFLHAEDLHKLMWFLGIPKAHLAGLSLGASVAVDFMALYPEQTLSIAVAAGGLRKSAIPEDANASLIAKILAEERQKKLESIEAVKKQGVDAYKKQWFDSIMKSCGPHKDGMKDKLWQMVNDWSAWQALNVESPWRLNPPVTVQIKEKKPDVPVLILIGKNDSEQSILVQEKLAEILPKSQKIYLKDAGHFSNMETPDQFTKAIMDFWASIGNSPAAN